MSEIVGGCEITANHYREGGAPVDSWDVWCPVCDNLDVTWHHDEARRWAATHVCDDGHLPDLGLTDDQWATRTAAGLRNHPGCDNTDTLAAKYRAGALTAHGVMAVLFGTDSAQHHTGHNHHHTH